MTRSTPGQILSCLDVLVEIDAGRRLHQAKAIPSRAQAELVSRQTRDARDFVLAQQEKSEWQNAAGRLMAAAESGDRDDLEAATLTLENALFVDGTRLKI